MAVFSTIRNFFSPELAFVPEIVVPAAETIYSIHPLTQKNLNEVLRLNLRCFVNGDNYTKYTFDYLLSQPKVISYRAATDTGEGVAFVFVMLNENGAAHLTTIGVAPEHRRRGIAQRLVAHVEKGAAKRGFGTMVLEVRVGNVGAQNLYRRLGYVIVQRINKYYGNGEDCFLMMKPIA